MVIVNNFFKTKNEDKKKENINNAIVHIIQQINK